MAKVITLPSNVEAERAVLGALMASTVTTLPSAWLRASAKVMVS
jgi:hypothetical protein